MGLQIADIVPKKEISLYDLRNKIIAVDAFNTIYQFLSTIRQPDGTPLMDSKKQVTSHLSGLFYRSTNLLTQGLKLVFVFDGEPPALKGVTHESRQEAKKEAQKKYEEARKLGKTWDMAKYAKQTTSLDGKKIQESKDLLHSLGIPTVQAPSEGEAQAAFMCRTNENIYAVASQDYDSLLFGAPRLIQNLTLARKRKTSGGAYVPINPELIELQKVLNTLQITQEQLISLGILAGTDYNPGGIKGIGQKKALALVKQYKQPSIIFKAMERQLSGQGTKMEFDWQEIFPLFKNPKVTKDYGLKFKKPDEKALRKILCEKHDFSEERVSNALERLEKQQEAAKQSELKKWF